MRTATSSGKVTLSRRKRIYRTVVRLSYYPHTLENFSGMIRDTFGPRAKHTVYADFKPLEQCPDPSFYIHVVEKPI